MRGEGELDRALDAYRVYEDLWIFGDLNEPEFYGLIAEFVSFDREVLFAVADEAVAVIKIDDFNRRNIAAERATCLEFFLEKIVGKGEYRRNEWDLPFAYADSAAYARAA